MTHFKSERAAVAVILAPDSTRIGLDWKFSFKSASNLNEEHLENFLFFPEMTEVWNQVDSIIT